MYNRSRRRFIESMVHADPLVMNAAIHGVCITRIFSSRLTDNNEILAIREGLADIIREIAEKRGHDDVENFIKMKLTWFDRHFEHELMKARGAVFPSIGKIQQAIIVAAETANS